MPSQKLDIEPIIVRKTRVKHPSGTKDGTVPGYVVRCHQCDSLIEVATGDLNRGRGLFCSRQCSGLYRQRTPEEILFSHINKTSECWEWTGSKQAFGHGQVRLADNKAYLAHRLSWMVHYGDIPDGLNVCHTCDNPSCVRPDHLFLGTQADNVLDAIEKGRMIPGANLEQVRKRGEQAPPAKLKESQVIEILKAIKAGKTQREIADKYQVAPSTIGSIAQNKNWKHIPRP